MSLGGNGTESFARIGRSVYQERSRPEKAVRDIRRLGVAQGYEFRVAQMVHVGPVRVLDLRDKLRFQPAAFGHFVGGQAGEVTV
jgi:hypothetical protein